MKNTVISNVSKLRVNWLKKIIESDIDYEFPGMVLVLTAAVIVMLLITV